MGSPTAAQFQMREEKGEATSANGALIEAGFDRRDQEWALDQLKAPEIVCGHVPLQRLASRETFSERECPGISPRSVERRSKNAGHLPAGPHERRGGLGEFGLSSWPCPWGDQQEKLAVRQRLTDRLPDSLLEGFRGW